MRAKLADLGGIPAPTSPAKFGKLIADETEKWAKVVKFANISESVSKVMKPERSDARAA
jgi:hypothetical protein